MCFRERRGESLQVYKPVSLSLKHIFLILRGLRARFFGRGLQLHFLSGSTDGSFYFRLGVRAIVRCAGSWTDDFGRFCISFRLFLNSRKPLSFSFLSIYTFFLPSNHYFDNICNKNELPMFVRSMKISARVNYIPCHGCHGNEVVYFNRTALKNSSRHKNCKLDLKTPIYRIINNGAIDDSNKKKLFSLTKFHVYPRLKPG